MVCARGINLKFVRGAARRENAAGEDIEGAHDEGVGIEGAAGENPDEEPRQGGSSEEEDMPEERRGRSTSGGDEPEPKRTRFLSRGSTPPALVRLALEEWNLQVGVLGLSLVDTGTR